MRAGVTLIEIAIVLVLVSIILGMGLPRMKTTLDGIAVRGATREIVTSFAVARHAAVARASHASVRIDSARAAVTVAVGADTLIHRLLGNIHRVQVHSNRDSMAYNPIGLGHGAANQTIIVRRGQKTDTVVVSRLGRVRH